MSYQHGTQYQKTLNEESQQTKDKLNKIYHALILNSENKDQSSISELIKILQENINNSDLISTLRKAAIKTLTKLVQYQQVREQLESLESFSIQELIGSVLECKFESVDQEEEEQILLLIQKLILKLLIEFKVNEDSISKGIKYFIKVLKIRALEEQDSYNTVQFLDLTKRNFHKLLHYVLDLNQQVSYTTFKEKIISKLLNQVKKALPKVDKVNSHNMRVIEYIIFMIKTVEDCLKKVEGDWELSQIIYDIKDILIEVVCIGSEIDDIMIKNQSQQLFMLLLKAILDCQMPLREELELLFTKLVLKPVIVQTKKMKQKEEISKTATTIVQEADHKSNHDDDEIENEDFIQVTYERTAHEDILLEMSLNFLLETYLLLSPYQIASLFALYDCQPFSENIVLKSLILIFKHCSSNPAQYLKQAMLIAEKFKEIDLSKVTISNYGPQGINYMLEQKSTIRKLAKDINVKFKVGLQKIDDLYKYIDESTPAEVASKILLFSRDMNIDKIAEIIGGKDDRAKKILVAYLEKLDYKQANIEQSLRKFLQTYRLAGVDSQVIMRILEQFSHKFHEYDYKKIFKSKEEAYEFAYLIIVLQTCQHNPNVKSKTDIKSFMESANNICPQSMDSFPPNFFQDIYNSVTKNAFFTPVSRSLLDENFNGYSLNEIEIRLSKNTTEQQDALISENEFINSADLTQKQLFHYNNSIVVPESLIPQAQRYLLNFLTQRFLRFSVSQVVSNEKQILKDDFSLLTDLVKLNKAFANNDNVDRIFQVIFKVIKVAHDEKLNQQLEQLLWENFDCIKKSLILIPKLSMQSFLRDEIRDSISETFQATHRLITGKDADVTKQVKRLEEVKQQKGTSILDMVYNYFTDNSEEAKNKFEKNEVEVLTEFRKRLLPEDKEENYQEQIEERFDEKTGQQWIKEQSRMHELITLVCSYIRDNLNQEEGILSLAFLDHLIQKSEAQETQEKLWVEIHLLLAQSMKLRMDIDIPMSGTPKEEVKGEYEVISTDTSQDSIEHPSTNQDFDFFHKETCPIKTKLYSCMTRHMIVMLHMKVSKLVMVFKKDNQHIVRDIQRVISMVIENSHDKTLDPLKTIEEQYLFQQLNKFTRPGSKTGQIHLTLPLKSYPKISKLLRLMLILLLKGTSKKEDSGTAAYHQMGLLTNVSYYLADLAHSIPFDLITLSQDILLRFQLPHESDQMESMFDCINITYENIFQAMLKTRTVNDESIFELWLKLLQLIQQKVIQHPSFKKSEEQSMRTFSILKNTVLNQPFEINEKNYNFIQRLFEDNLLWMTFESMNAEKKELDKVSKEKDDLLIKASFDDSLEQACIFSVNTLTDIFIYYISMIYSEQGLEGEKQENKTKVFTFLWLNFLKVLLHYAEQSHDIGYSQLVQTVYENIKRIIEFLMHEQILKDDQENQEAVKIWKLTWDYVGAFFTQLKTTIINESTATLKQ